MSLTVTVVDDQTGEKQTRVVPDNDHIVITHGDNFISSVGRYANGTTQYTIKREKD